MVAVVAKVHHALADGVASANLIARALRNALLVSQAETGKELTRVAEARKTIDDRMRKLDQSILSEAGKEQMRKVKAASATYIPLQEKFIELIQGDLEDEAKVLMLTMFDDDDSVFASMRAGARGYVLKDADDDELIRSIASLFADPEAPFTGKTVAITGVKGGVGASSIAHNLAWALSERCKVNSTLVDLDLNFGTTGLDFNQDTAATIADALMSPDRFDDAVMGRLITKATDRATLERGLAEAARYPYVGSLDRNVLLQAGQQIGIVCTRHKPAIQALAQNRRFAALSNQL